MKREIFPDSEQGKVWIQGQSIHQDSKVLLTISSASGEQTALITPDQITYSNAKLFVQAPPERISTKAQKRQQQFGRVTTTLGYLLSALLLSFSALSIAGFVKARVVLTGSMSPAIKSGDMIILIPPKHIEPKINDVIAYTGKRFDGSSVGTFTHRILSGDLKNGFVVKGDANRDPDVQRPKLEDISGVVVFVIPFLGTFLTPKALLILVPMIFGLWLVIDALRKDGK